MSGFFASNLKDELRLDLMNAIKRKANYAPRSQQLRVGPSEVGQECDRRIAFLMCRTGRHGNQSAGTNYGDVWKSVIGTAAHEWLHDCLLMDNEHLGRERWLAEHGIVAWDDVEGGIGTCDIYDFDTQTVIDWKNPAAYGFNKFKKADHPSSQYFTQVNIYALGHVLAGRPVKNVAIMAIQQGGMLRNSILWTDEYRPEVAHAAHEKMRDLTTIVKGLDIKNNRANIELVEANPGDWCMHCPWLSPEPSGPYECRGNLK